MTTSSTSSLLSAKSPTTNLPLAMTTNLPSVTSTTTNLPPATSTTSHLLLETPTTSHLPSATSSTSHLPPTTSSTSHLLLSISTAMACNINEADLFVVLVIREENLLIEAKIEELDDVTMNEDVEANVNLKPVKINTPRPSLYLHNETPGGTTYWEPNVDEPYLTFEGKRFDTIEECVEFYSVYAEKRGFEVKKLAQKKTKSGLVKSKYVMCNREGVPKEININTFDPQNSDKQIRNMRYLITGESDAQMLINKMENRKNFVPNFTFHYLVENSELVAMFWADEVAKCNYKEFGDIISFDATFQTNKYDMVFVTFTRIDNHLKCVKFGSGMLLKEDTEAYTLLLTSVVTAHEKQPTMVVTDQDGAMKRIMIHKDLSRIYDETDFKERFGKFVWNMFMDPLEFKGKWSKLVEDFGFQNHKWMRKMIDLRYMWLPAYFIYSLLFGFVRTTSRSESENAFFKNFTNHGSTLVNFMMCFESTMERQCYRQEVLDFKTFDSAPKLHTKLTIEIHVCKVYTRTISLLVQKEIYEGCWACQIQEFKKEEGCEIVKVRDIRAGAYITLYKEEEKERVIQEKDKVVDYQ
nr:hypothetical protein [Tanacetum cinerariifolium]